MAISDLKYMVTDMTTHHIRYVLFVSVDMYRSNSFIVDLRQKFTVINMNEIPVFVQSSELSNRT